MALLLIGVLFRAGTRGCAILRAVIGIWIHEASFDIEVETHIVQRDNLIATLAVLVANTPANRVKLTLVVLRSDPVTTIIHAARELSPPPKSHAEEVQQLRFLL